ncbi:calpain-2 catalytic subunit-like [Anomaloglossus baeobatrachus]|uniref:calpain-2 catalytic subunit-like n=1 Tax=Anomaloglossus baeobatrachus TaxID=238106 RepID=UPI003F50497D
MSLIRSDSCFGSYVSPMGTQDQPKKFRNQDYDMLREWHLKKGARFTDESFPANVNSIGLRLKNEFDTKRIVWKRPPEICEEPHFTVDGMSLFDILQSKFGDCWVLSAIGSVTLKPRLLEKIMPQNQEFTKNYAGIFHFRLWHLGEWVDVVIDDRLPFLDGNYLSVQPSCDNEFWPCLLEKAYAKFLGSYENLHWGDPAEAFGNLTGGLTMTFDLKNHEAHNYWNMISLASRDTIMACISDKQDPTSKNQSKIHWMILHYCIIFNHIQQQHMKIIKEDIHTDNGQMFSRESMRRSTRRDNHPQQLHMENIPEDFHIDNGQSHPQQLHMENVPEDFHIDNGQVLPQQQHMENMQQNFQNNMYERRQQRVPENALQENYAENHPAQQYMDGNPDAFHTQSVLEKVPRVYSEEQKKKMMSEKCPENVVQGNGLVERHAYSITNFAEVPFRDGNVRLIRIWNPWGFGEWKGKWNDRCPLWKELREEDRLKLHRIDEDGEFWMCWEDFINEFSRLIICNHVPDFFDWGDQHKKWYKNMFRSRWTKDNLSWNHIDKDFCNKNPLYRIRVTSSDQVQSGVNVVVSLMQTSRNRYKYGDWLPIGFVLFELPDSEDKLPTSFLTPEKISNIKAFKKHDITEAFNLAPGRYGIIPYTTQKEHESPFLFQVFLKSEDCTDEMGPQNQHNKGGEIPEHDGIFRLYATKGSKLHVWDLKRLLNDMVRKEYSHPFNEKFSTDGCREILASADVSRKGKLDSGAFVDLWKTVNRYKDLFCKLDSKRCGFINLTELRKIIQKSGLNVQNELLQQLYARYSDSQGKLSFVNYMLCMIRLKGIIKTFYKLSTDGKSAYVQLDKWLQLLM